MLSLDMNVLPSATTEDMLALVDIVVELGAMDGQLRTRRPHLRKRGLLRKWQATDEGQAKIVLSTFGGHDARFGGQGWPGFLEACRSRGVEVRMKAGQNPLPSLTRQLRSTLRLRSSCLRNAYSKWSTSTRRCIGMEPGEWSFA